MTASARGRRDNGLDSDAYSPVADVDPRLADHLLDVLGLREVAAYVEPAPVSGPVTADRLYVAADQTGEARQVLTQLAAELGIEVAHPDRPVDPSDDLLAGLDTDAEFAALVAGLETELDEGQRRELTSLYVIDPATLPTRRPDDGNRRRRGDTDDIEVEHFVPPPPPPLPRVAKATVLAVFITLLGVLVIAFGSTLGLPSDLPLPLGVILILFGTVLMILRLRPEPWDSDDDDGAVV